MKKLFAIIFSLMVICSYGQEMPTYTFHSTSSYQSMVSNPVTVYEVGAVSPYYNSGPRKAVSPDGPRPGYDPSDPFKPEVPVGDPIIPLTTMLLLYVGYDILVKPRWKKQ